MKNLMGLVMLAVVIGSLYGAGQKTSEEDFTIEDSRSGLEVYLALQGGEGLHDLDASGKNLLMRSAAGNQNRMVLITLLHMGADVNSRSADGYSPLMYASAGNQNPEIISLRLKAGADIHATDTEHMTPLMLAALHNDNPQVIAAFFFMKSFLSFLLHRYRD